MNGMSCVMMSSGVMYSICMLIGIYSMWWWIVIVLYDSSV